MADIRDELGVGEEKGPLAFLSRTLERTAHHRKPLVLFLLALLFGLYVGHLLYGKNSLFWMIDLQDEADRLAMERERLIEENAALQKEYFELRQLEGTTE